MSSLSWGRAVSDLWSMLPIPNQERRPTRDQQSNALWSGVVSRPSRLVRSSFRSQYTATCSRVNFAPHSLLRRLRLSAGSKSHLGYERLRPQSLLRAFESFKFGPEVELGALRSVSMTLNIKFSSMFPGADPRFVDAPNKRLQRTRRERASSLSCVGEPLKRRRWIAS